MHSIFVPIFKPAKIAEKQGLNDNKVPIRGCFWV